jgi:hypothetical protein
MAYTLQQLSDLEDIRTLKHRYFRCIDTANLAELDGLFTDDVRVDYRGGGYRVQLQGRTEFIEFLANSFNAEVLARHHGHMPEILLVGEHRAEGTWYLEDLFISLPRRDCTMGTALYRDHYQRVDGRWKIAQTEYDRVIELWQPLDGQTKILAHYLARHGRRPSECTDNSRYLTWSEPA